MLDLTCPTPLIRVEEGVYAKLETCHKTGSVKDRFVFEAVKRGVLRGEITRNTVLIEATSGNTGISLAAAGAQLGLPVKIVMPRNMSDERKQMLRRFGAELIEVEPSDFFGAIEERNRLVGLSSSYWSPMQFENPLNIAVHSGATGPEIATQMQHLFGFHRWHFLSGAGTGGTLMGIIEFFDYTDDAGQCKVMQVVPAEDTKTHGIQGINDGSDFLLDRSRVSDQVLVPTEVAAEEARKFARTHGILVGISSGANLWAAKKWVRENCPKEPVVTLLCDRGERYLSIL